MNKSISFCSEFKNKTAILNKKGVYVQIGERKTGEMRETRGIEGAERGHRGTVAAEHGYGDGGDDGKLSDQAGDGGK